MVQGKVTRYFSILMQWKENLEDEIGPYDAHIYMKAEIK